MNDTRHTHPTARHQPPWTEHPAWADAMRALAGAEAVVTWPDVQHLAAGLEQVAVGNGHVLQIGDCAENIFETSPAHTLEKAEFIDALGRNMSGALASPVLQVGRMGGQFAKPRSSATELVDGQEVSSFFGQLINSDASDGFSRRPDPRRMLWGHQASARVERELRARVGETIWTSHEALLLDYESMLVRPTGDGRMYLSSTHFPWIGERTRQVDSGHVRLMTEIANPVGVKVGPSARVDDVRALCGALDPARVPGRVSLILRLGADQVASRVPDLVDAVRQSGHRPIWLSDPVHGNTRVTSAGTKVRDLDTVIAEAVAVREVLGANGAHAGGLHVEATPSEVVECIGEGVSEADVDGGSSLLCDPRLNRRQAQALIEAWCR